MRAVLGLDAAWTLSQPSGVALIQETPAGWRSLALAPSYDAFLALAEGTPVDWSCRNFPGSQPDPAMLLAAAEKLLDGFRVTVVAVDMPLATVRIVGRRLADRLVSRAFGAMQCAVHSPSPERPGSLATLFAEEFGRSGYPLATGRNSAEVIAPALLEVYPHPAIVNLLQLDTRLKYKVARARRYWPASTPAERCSLLLANLAVLQGALSNLMIGVEIPLPQQGSGQPLATLKRIEDTLDALVCAWVGVTYLEGAANAYGDETAAIWIPHGSPERSQFQYLGPAASA